MNDLYYVALPAWAWVSIGIVMWVIIAIVYEWARKKWGRK